VSVKKGLGKGFDVLVPMGLDVTQVSASPEERIHKLAIDVVRPKSGQPRKHFDDAALRQLANSIIEHGIMQPLVVVEVEQNMYSIIAGERRWRAAKLVGLSEVPVVVRTASELQQVELALLENIQREDLTPLETAHAIVRLHDQFGQSYEQIAKRLGKAPSTVANSIRLLALPEVMQTALTIGDINEGHARALLALVKQPSEQLILFKQILLHGWSVRQAESFAAAAKKSAIQSVDDSPKSKKVDVHKATGKMLKAVGDYLKAPVKVQHTAKGGKLVISFKSEEDLERIVDQISKLRKP
jgi:ParB family chromosome partitioning protein